MTRLAEIADRPDLIDTLDGPACGDLIIQAQAIVTRALVRIALTHAPTDRREPESDLIGYRDAAQLYGIAVGTLYNRVARGDLPYTAHVVREGGRLPRFSRSAILRHLRIHAAGSADELAPRRRRKRAVLHPGPAASPTVEEHPRRDGA